MAFERITEDDLQGKGNLGRPDTPGVDTTEMQRILDELPREVIVPAFNRLAEQLEAADAAASLGARPPEGLPEGTPATAQGVLEAMQAGAAEHAARTDNPHAVTAAQTGAYTKEETEEAIGRRVVEIGAGDMAQAVYDPARLGVDVTVQTYTHTRSGTVHNFAGSGANGRALMTADVQAGDTFAVNGEPVAAYMGTESAADAMAGSEWSGRWVSFVFDGETLNFKGGGGVGSADLALATATEATVFSGKTFYAGDSKELRTGTALSTVTDVAAGNLFNGKKAYDNNGNLITGTALSQAVNVTANNIPSGVTAYNQAGQRITGNGSGVFKYKSGSCFLNGSSKSISCDFHIWMVALYGGSWLSDCVLFTGTSNSGSTTFYKCPDSDFIDQENYQGTISVSGGNYATIWYNAGDGCSIYYYVVGV